VICRAGSQRLLLEFLCESSLSLNLARSRDSDYRVTGWRAVRFAFVDISNRFVQEPT